MVEQDTVNIRIDVRFILRARVMPYNRYFIPINGKFGNYIKIHV